ncbi:hypothetical protein BD289DRAFT_506970 [Coniella lustricola]|uniref:Uncharacterized protein n=1 Tax=Coniella lustricola TaxID=2025994 RepID=A0A2T3A4F7_9PEZI|nr:hypothetical protein BD289DRAFT_506970 [Coniella lustricola]
MSTHMSGLDVAAQVQAGVAVAVAGQPKQPDMGPGGVSGRRRPASSVEQPTSFPEQLQQRAEATTQRAASMDIELTEKEGPRGLVGQLPRACEYRVSSIAAGRDGHGVGASERCEAGQHITTRRDHGSGKQRGQVVDGSDMPCLSLYRVASARFPSSSAALVARWAVASPNGSI